MRHSLTGIVLLASVALAGCRTMAPDYTRPEAPVPGAFPGTQTGPLGTRAATDIPWQEFLQDPQLRAIVGQALETSRDLRSATIDIERARALYRIQRSELLPTVSVSASAVRQRIPQGVFGGAGGGFNAEQYSANVGVSGYELDVFGRIRSLNDQALQRFLATEQARGAVQIGLVAEVSLAWLTYGADANRLRLARETLDNQLASLQLTRQRFEAGATSALSVRQAETTVESARVDVAQFTSQVAQDRNALDLLVGSPVPDAQLPTASATVAGGLVRPAQPTDVAGGLVPQAPSTGVAGGLVRPAQEAPEVLADVSAGTPSDLLQRRPDILAAEHDLRAAYASIGAARARFFPTISLTGSLGTASTALSSLFTAGTGAWSFAPQIVAPIFTGGRNRATLQVAQADQQLAVAAYERAIQVAFREVADALADRSTMDEQLRAQQSLVEAAADGYRLADARFRGGVDNYLTVLDAQRSLYAAQQGLIAVRFARTATLVSLYRALGGGWASPSPPASPVASAQPASRAKGRPSGAGLRPSPIRAARLRRTSPAATGTRLPVADPDPRSAIRDPRSPIRDPPDKSGGYGDAVADPDPRSAIRDPRSPTRFTRRRRSVEHGPHAWRVFRSPLERRHARRGIADWG